MRAWERASRRVRSLLRSRAASGTTVVPQALRDDATDRAFWEAYCEFEGGRDDEGEPLVCRFVVDDRHAIVLTITADLGMATLELDRSGVLTELGWDDDAHWHPHVLRWEELDLIGRCVARADPTLPHPGLPLLLLARFAPITVGDDVDAIVALLEAAWRTVPSVTANDVTRWIEHLDHRQDSFVWTGADGLWTISQPEDERGSAGLYSLREVDGPPEVARGLASLVGAARALVGPAPAGTAPQRVLRPRQRFDLELPGSGRIDVGALDRALRAEGIGDASPHGASLRPTGDGGFETIASTVAISLWGDLEAGVAAVVAGLASQNLPAGAALVSMGRPRIEHHRWP